MLTDKEVDEAKRKITEEAVFEALMKHNGRATASEVAKELGGKEHSDVNDYLGIVVRRLWSLEEKGKVSNLGEPDFIIKSVQKSSSTGMFKVVRKPEEIAELLIKICKENDDRVGQALYNALASKRQNLAWARRGDKMGYAYDTFNIEDDALLAILKAYYRSSVRGNRKVD